MGPSHRPQLFVALSVLAVVLAGTIDAWVWQHHERRRAEGVAADAQQLLEQHPALVEVWQQYRGHDAPGVIRVCDGDTVEAITVELVPWDGGSGAVEPESPPPQDAR